VTFWQWITRRGTPALRPWDAWRARHGLPRHTTSFGGCRRASTLSFGCDKGTNPLETHFARMTAGDPNAIAAAARLSAKEKAGTASSAELAALWGLRAIGENAGVTSAPAAVDPATRAMVLLQQAQQVQGDAS
jgi:hypothetical protein